MNVLENFEFWLNSNNWIVKKNNVDFHLDKNHILFKYDNLFKNEFYIQFLKTFSMLENADGDKWFLLVNDFRNDYLDNEFAWNEFEKMSLESENDKSERDEISKWWAAYLPIYMSVKGSYSYYAMDVLNNVGSIIYGCEPIFEDSIVVANNFEDFLSKIIKGSISL